MFTNYEEWRKIATNWSLLSIPDGQYQATSESGSNSYYFTAYVSYGYLSTSVNSGAKNSMYDILGIRNF